MPEIEHINRNFEENHRFYNTHKVQRKHGLKFVPKPVTDTVQELIEEQAIAEIKMPNYLLNARYDSDMGARDEAKERLYSSKPREESGNLTQLMTRAESSENVLTGSH